MYRDAMNTFSPFFRHIVKHVFCFTKNSLNVGHISKNDNGHQKVIARYRYCYPDLYIDSYRHRNNHFRFFQHRTNIFDSVILIIDSYFAHNQLRMATYSQKTKN